MTLDKREYRIMGTHCTFNMRMDVQTHFHKCRCGTIWEHATPKPGEFTKHQYRERHSCPDCGCEEYFKMDLDDVQRAGVIKYPWRGFVKPIPQDKPTILEFIEAVLDALEERE